MRDSWMECSGGDGFTYPDDIPIKRIDYLLLTGAVHCSTARVVSTRVSDHRPLLVELTLRPTPDEPRPLVPTSRETRSVAPANLDPRTPLTADGIRR